MNRMSFTARFTWLYMYSETEKQSTGIQYTLVSYTIYTGSIYNIHWYHLIFTEAKTNPHFLETDIMISQLMRELAEFSPDL